MTFRNALIISVIIHASIGAAFGYKFPHTQAPKVEKKAEVEYVNIKEAAAPAIETPRIELPKNVVIKPVQATAAKEAEVRKTEDYINYYQLIREKIRRRLKQRYADRTREGDVTIVFTLDSGGRLLKADIDEASSGADGVLKDMARNSVIDAAPFPAFPKGVDLPRMSFSITISFRRK